MLGTIVNVSCIAAGSVIGSVFKKGIKEQHQEALFNAMGLAALGLGINAVVQNMPNSNYPVLFIVSLALGSLIGSMIDLNKRCKGISTGILLFCIGTLSILGPIQSALYGDNT